MTRHFACLIDVDIRGTRLYEGWARRDRPFADRDRENLENTLALFGYNVEAHTVRTVADLKSLLAQGEQWLDTFNCLIYSINHTSNL